jgi:glycosyltransferase involved in cell wall biosynthesis
VARGIRKGSERLSSVPVSRKPRCVIVFGQIDTPTDGVEDYCRYLAEGLRAEQFDVLVVRLRWEEIGVEASLAELDQRISDTPVDWFLFQYTALAWSQRGFPTLALRVVKHLKKKARCAVTFHDYGPYPGMRWIDRLRRSVQLSVMHKLLRVANVSVLTVPREQLPWVPPDITNDVFIPVAANLPAPEKAWLQSRPEINRTPVVAVFSISAAQHGSQEVQFVAEAVKFASNQVGLIKVVVIGRNSQTGGEQLRAALAGTNNEVEIRGIVAAEDIVRTLGASDVLLFPRGPVSTNRGSAMAGIACGLPVIAQEGKITSPIIKEAGVVLIPSDRGADFGAALAHVLSDADYRASLAARSRAAQSKHFSWAANAGKYAAFMNESTTQKRSESTQPDRR